MKVNTPSYCQFLLFFKISYFSPLFTTPVTSHNVICSSSIGFSGLGFKPVIWFLTNNYLFVGGSNAGIGSLLSSISDLFSKGTQPKFTKIPVSTLGFAGLSPV